VNLTSYQKVTLLATNYIKYVNYSIVKTSQENNNLNTQLHVANT